MGSLGAVGMANLVRHMPAACGELTPSSVFVDVGSATGEVPLFVSAASGARSIGIEVDGCRHATAIRRTLSSAAQNAPLLCVVPLPSDPPASCVMCRPVRRAGHAAVRDALPGGLEYVQGDVRQLGQLALARLRLRKTWVVPWASWCTFSTAQIRWITV